MKLRNFLFLITFLLVIMGSSQERVGHEGRKVLKLFAKRVSTHDVKRTMVLIDGSFKQIQLINILKNDTLSFLNNFFCGKTAENNSVNCANFMDIKECKFKHAGYFMQKDKNFAMAPVIFTITLKSGIVFDTQLMLLRYSNAGKKKFLYRLAGIVG